MPADTLAAVTLTYLFCLGCSDYGRNECRRMVVARSNCSRMGVERRLTLNTGGICPCPGSHVWPPLCKSSVIVIISSIIIIIGASDSALMLTMCALQMFVLLLSSSFLFAQMMSQYTGDSTMVRSVSKIYLAHMSTDGSLIVRRNNHR